MPENSEIQAAWYVVHTYSGYENKVMDSLKKTVENRGFQDIIQEVRIPAAEVVEAKKVGKRAPKPKKLFPGYVLVKMVMNERAWYIVRNTRGVTGFVGPGSKPVPLTEAEIESMESKVLQLRFPLEVGDTVTILDGSLKDFMGVVDAIDYDTEKLRVIVQLFGRDTRIDNMDLSQVKKV